MKYRTTAVVGRLARHSFISTIKNLCWIKDIGVRLEEDRGLFESNYRIELTGSEESIHDILSALRLALEQESQNAKGECE